MTLSSPPPASHPCLCEEPGSVRVPRSWKQSRPPGHGCEGQEHGGAEGLEGGDPGVPGVVTFSQQHRALGPGGHWAESLKPTGSLAFPLKAGSNTQVSGELPCVATVFCLGTGNGSGLRQGHLLSGDQQPVWGLAACGVRQHL